MSKTTDSPSGEITGPGAAITIEGLTKKFGRTDVISDLTLTVPKGSVYALLGRNGVGKSTLLQLMLGLLEPTKGKVSVLGLDPQRNGRELRERVGYIPERLPLYDWMTVKQLLDFAAAQYRHWSKPEEDRLVVKFRLDRAKKVRDLSRGNIALLALVMAMSHQPDLVLLDECTSGMDPIFREEFDRSVIETLHESERTVVFASHQLRELEMLCDWVGIMHNGKMLLEMPVDTLKASVRMLRMNTEAEPPKISTELKRERMGRDWLITVRDYAALPPNPFGPGAPIAEVIDLTLEQIFVALLTYEESLP